MKRIKRIARLRPSPATLVATTALVLAMSGAAIADHGRFITSNEIKNRTIKGMDIGEDRIKGRHVKEGKLKGRHVRDDSLTGKQINESTLQLTHPGGEALAFNERAAATDGATNDAAQNAAPKVALVSNGPLSVYGRCFRNTTTGETFGRIYVETAANGAVFESGTGDSKDGGTAVADFLNVNTPENDREIDGASAVGAAASVDYGNAGFFAAAPAQGAPAGVAIHGTAEVAVKSGDLAGGNGVYGDGNVCLFSGHVIG